ncbi:MAG: PD-(D/E)XK nuclease family protein [Clostridia bacterium]
MDKDISLGKKVIYFVPSQMRVLSEENYIAFQKKSGIIDINITTISSYIKDYLSEYKIEDSNKYISKLDRKLILSRVIINNPNLFKMFNKVKNKDGFLENLNIYMDIFKKEELDVKMIENIQISDKLLEYKLKEITNVYKKYIECTKEKYIDEIDETDMFLKFYEENIDAASISNTSIYFDSYNNFTTHEFKFIKLLFKLGFNLTFAVTTDIASKYKDININELSNLLISENENIFTTPNYTILSLLKCAKKFNQKVDTCFLRCNYSNAKADIKYLANNLFIEDNFNKIKSQNININLWSNMYMEVENIAKDISNKVRQGYRFKDFAIYTSAIEEYSYIISKTLYEYNIPVYIDSKISLDSNILTKYILKYIEVCKSGYKRETVFELLKYNLNNLTFEEISYLENYCLEFNIDRYKFEKVFYYNNTNNGILYDLEKLNLIREKLLTIFSKSRLFFEEKHTTIEIVNNIYENLVNSEVLTNYTSVINEMKNSDSPSTKYIGNVGHQMWDNICLMFNSIVKVYENDKIGIVEFEKVFKYALKDVAVKGIPPTIDEVQVLDINSSKSGEIPYIFFVGVNEDKLPKKIEDDIFFGDRELGKLNTLNIKFKETSLSKINMQLYNISEHLKDAKCGLYFSFSSSDVSGKSLRPSSLISDIQQLVDIDVLGTVTNDETKKSEVYSKKAAFERLMYLVSLNEEITDEMIVLYKYVVENGSFNDIIKYVRVADKLSEKTITKINGEKFTTSVSRLELFKKCPFSYFLKYGLKLNERKIFNITSLDTGSFMHNVLEKFSIYLFENKIAWQEILIDKDKYIVVLDEIIEAQLETTFVKHKENIKYAILKQKLKNTMNKVIMTVAQSFNQSKFVPYGYEIEFKEGSMFAPIQIKLDNSSIMYIIGKIDRVDTMKLNDVTYARIVDYKSSSKDLKLDDIKEGLSLQLITYLSSFISNIKEEKVFPAGMMYFTLSDKLVNLQNYTQDDVRLKKALTESLRMKGIFLKDIEVLNLMDNKLDGDERLLDISARTVNSDKKSNKLLDANEFSALCMEVGSILKNIGIDILSGNIGILPNKKTKQCEYCEFGSICRKENLC